jgi:hypothetical protein
LDDIDVVAIFFKYSLSWGSIFSAISFNNSIAFSALFLNPSTIIVGWTFLFINSSAFSKSEPAKRTTDVVPSPTSLSTLLEISTMILAAGCSTSISLRIVAPSFVIVTSPNVSTNILSMPLGPRLVFTICVTSLAAVILFCCASLSFVSVLPSFNNKMGT